MVPNAFVSAFAACRAVARGKPVALPRRINSVGSAVSVRNHRASSLSSLCRFFHTARQVGAPLAHDPIQHSLPLGSHNPPTTHVAGLPPRSMLNLLPSGRRSILLLGAKPAVSLCPQNENAPAKSGALDSIAFCPPSMPADPVCRPRGRRLPWGRRPRRSIMPPGRPLAVAVPCRPAAGPPCRSGPPIRKCKVSVFAPADPAFCADPGFCAPTTRKSVPGQCQAQAIDPA
jgi:hypothetical protein